MDEIDGWTNPEMKKDQAHLVSKLFCAAILSLFRCGTAGESLGDGCRSRKVKCVRQPGSERVSAVLHFGLIHEIRKERIGWVRQYLLMLTILGGTT